MNDLDIIKSKATDTCRCLTLKILAKNKAVLLLSQEFNRFVVVVVLGLICFTRFIITKKMKSIQFACVENHY